MQSGLSKKQEDASIYRELHLALAMLLRKNRFIRQLTHTGLSRAEVHVLIETQARGTSSIKELQPLLQLDQSSVSRIVKSLIEQKRLQSSASLKDKRVKVISLTIRGRQAVTQIDSVAGSIFKSFFKNLSKDEAQELCNFFTAIANWYGQPICPTRTGENEIRMQQRRMSRALGVLSKNVFNSKLSSIQWVILKDIIEASYPLNPKQISDELNIPANSLSILLEKLEKLKLIKRVSASHDSRFVELHPTKKAIDFVEKIEVESATNLESVLHDNDIENAEYLLQIFHRYLDYSSNDIKSNIPSGYRIHILDSDELRSNARKLAVTEIVHGGQAEYIPASLISEDSISFGLFDSYGDMHSVCELQGSKRTYSLTLLASTNHTTPSITFAFLQSVLHKLKEDFKVEKISLDFKPALELVKNTEMRITDNTIELRAL